MAGRRKEPDAVIQELVDWFVTRGHVRQPNEARREREGQSYKKGFEVRFILNSEADLLRLRRCLQAAGIRPGRPFEKRVQFVQPVYGRAAVEWFLAHSPAGRARRTAGFTSNGRRLVRRLRPVERS